jgi:cyclin-dependent kinase
MLCYGGKIANAVRVLGTPNEHEWPGVTSFPDFKPSFPKWNRTDIASIVTSLDDVGLDLLDALLVYDHLRKAGLHARILNRR